jgi:hypothetical protein
MSLSVRDLCAVAVVLSVLRSGIGKLADDSGWEPIPSRAEPRGDVSRSQEFAWATKIFDRLRRPYPISETSRCPSKTGTQTPNLHCNNGLEHSQFGFL